MTQHSRQQGITAIGLLMGLAILGFGALLALRLFPIYLESFKIDTALKSVIKDPRLAEMSNRDIIATLLRRLDVDDVQRINSQNHRNHVTINKKNNKVAITVNYRAEAPLFGNLGLVADFRKNVQQ